MKRFCFALAALLPLTAWAVGPIVIFTIQDLGTLGGTIAIGNAINSNGVVAGTSYLMDDTGQDAFIGTGSGLMDLGTLGGAQSFGTGINVNGVVVGSSNFDSGFNQHAFFSGAGGGSLMDMGTLGGANSIATGVNGAVQVSGYSLATGTNHAFLSAAGAGALQDLGTLPGGTTSQANAVNASGQVAGFSNTVTESGSVNHAFISDANGGALHDIGTLTGGDNSFANGLNDMGQVVGRSRTADFTIHAFRSGPNGSGPLLDLGTLGDSLSSSDAYGINSSGSVVGHSLLSGNSTQHAFLYTTKIGLMDLNNLIAAGSGWELTDAKAINDAGQITGQGNINGEMHVFLLTPIPPSATISSITKMPNTHMLVQGVGSPPLQTFTVEATDDLTTGFQPLAMVMAGNDGSLMFEDTDAANFTRRFYRFVYP